MKEEPFQFEEVEINQYLSDCIEELQLELQDKGITVRWDAQKDTSILVKGDRENYDALLQILFGTVLSIWIKKKDILEFV